MARSTVCLTLICAATLSTGCVATPKTARDTTGQPVIAKSELPNVTRIQQALMTLTPTGDAAEAQRIAEVAVLTGAESAKKYGVIFGPAEHNWMVNRGLRERGLCWQWTWDMAAAVAPLHPKTFDFHWGISNAALFNEHNSIIVTARGQPFDTGITLDPWRSSGYVTAVRVTNDGTFKVPVDRDYKWVERRPPAGAAEIYRPGQKIP
jgi:hypothetical protein